MGQNKNFLPFYRCPLTQTKLNYQKTTSNGQIKEYLVNQLKTKYSIQNNIPDFTYPKNLLLKDQTSRQSYDQTAKNYDDLQTVTFSILCQDEKTLRQEMIDLLKIKKGNTILETASGTGLNIPYIAKKLQGEGRIFMQDISKKMLENSHKNTSLFSTKDLKIFKSIGNAAYLPFEDHTFDAALSFGGIGVFSDEEKAIKELARVVKPRGKVVFGDEGIGPWLKNTLYGKILTDNNHFYFNEAPVHLLPVQARDVVVRWIAGGTFYLLEFTVGEGEPHADFDFPIPGQRGGTLNTRYFGKLEGVSTETKELALKAREKTKKSMHAWLDETVKKAANKQLKK